jgi:hypothetical protein
MRCLRYTNRRGAAGAAIRLAGVARLAAVAILAAGLLSGCANAYKALRPTPGNPACLEALKPYPGSALYRTEVDVIGKHLGGLLIIKTMPDSSTRLVFTSEMGMTFFDFGFSKEGQFTVYRIIQQMDKKAVLKTLRKDFELILWAHTDAAHLVVRTDGHNLYYGFPQEKGINYYITDSACTHLLRAEKASRRKPFVVAEWPGFTGGTPDSVFISHTKFHFTIALKRLEQ